MILGGIAAVCIPFFIAGIIIYIQLSNSLLELTEEKSVHIAQNIAAFIDATLMQETKLVSAIAADPDIVDASKTGDYRIAQTALEAIQARIGSGGFAFFLTDKDGIIRADSLFPQQIGIDLSDRNYFLQAKEGKTTVEGPLFPKGTASPEVPIIVVCAPIRGKNNFYGIVALPIEAEFLAKSISGKKLGQTGYTFLINAEGLVIVHPKRELILRLHLFDRPGTEEMAKIIHDKKTGTASYFLEGSEMIAGLARVDLTGWIVVFNQSRDEIMSPVNKILSAMFISAVIFLIITIFIIIVFFSRISHPINKLMEVMKQVTQHSTEIILQIGLDRKIIFANPAFEKITGIKSESIIGTEPDLNTPNNISANVIWDLLKAGTPWSGRVELKGNKADPITLDVMLVPLRDDRGFIQGYLEIGRDITAELMFEKRLQQAQKLEAVGTLAGGIAHDFNNILSGIFGYAELALMEKSSASETERYIRQILAASERARDLVSQILTFSRKTDVELRPLMPKSVLKEALKLLRASIPATIDIQSKINSDSAIMAEPTQIHQVVMNLFTNSVHAIRENTGTITLELEDFMVDDEFVKTHPNIKQGKHIMLRVSDTGNGIEPKILDHIFEPFYTTKSQGEGTGLGLSVVHGIVQKLGGIVTTYSEIGKGATFNIIIPTIQSDDAEPYQNGSVIREGEERIVVVDDEPDAAAMIRHMLNSVGYKVTAFTDSGEALEAIQTNPNGFDLIIANYSMPHITGLEMAKKLRESGIKIPMILTSGYLDENIETAARKAGISDVVVKPINTYKLTDAIHTALR